jgi:hypothetical protein
MSESFPGLLRAEWTKLRSVNRWVATLLGAAVLTTGLSLLAASASKSDANVHQNFVVGPRADPVTDSFYFVHQPVTGNTTLTVRVASLVPPQVRKRVDMGGAGMTLLPDPSPFAGAAAGIIIKDGTRSGSSYAAVLLTGANGVRMQSDFAADVRGSTSRGTRWLRLVRTGGTITGYESADGVAWRTIGTATPKSASTSRPRPPSTPRAAAEVHPSASARPGPRPRSTASPSRGPRSGRVSRSAASTRRSPASKRAARRRVANTRSPAAASA